MTLGRGIPISSNLSGFRGFFLKMAITGPVPTKKGDSGGSLYSHVMNRKNKIVYVKGAEMIPRNPPAEDPNAGNPIKQLNEAHNGLGFTTIGIPLYSPAEAGRQNPANSTTATVAANSNHESEIIGGETV